jgi:hypothetical protein
VGPEGLDRPEPAWFPAPLPHERGKAACVEAHMTSTDLALLPGDRPVALVLRHAERPPIVHGHVGAELALTVDGRAASRRLGVELGNRLRSSRTSPMRRCRETAQLICEGAGIDS